MQQSLDKLQLGPWSGQIALTSDYIGLVTTYAQVANKRDVLRAWSNRRSTLVIFDEIHHCGEEENLTWGEAIKYAFAPATRRLLLSGTPFRSDNNPIPFVKYEADTTDPRQCLSIADHSYGYGDALKDENVVRHVVFPSWDGHLVWENFGEIKSASFKDTLNLFDARDRLRTAIHPEGEWISDVLKAADQKLDYIRQEEGHINAGGLVVAQDQEAAIKLSKLLEEITGYPPTLAISDAEDASQAISRFRNSQQKWIVAVKMVSEGVDIKRLRIGVFATNVMTRTFFRQVIGRVIRWDSSWNDLPDQTAWFYLPEDERLVTLAKEIKIEVTDVIKTQEADDAKKRLRQGDIEVLQTEFNTYEFTSSDGEESNHYFSGEGFSQEELREAVSVLNFPGFERVPAAAKALAWRSLRQSIPAQGAAASIAAPPIPKQAQKESLQSQIKKKTGRLVRICQQEGITIPGNNAYQTVHIAWGKRRQYSHQSTVRDLEAKLDWLQALIQRALRGDRTLTSEFI